MGLFRVSKNSFNSGEIDETLTHRPELEVYVNGVGKMRNALPLAQGGATRAAGLQTLTRIPPFEGTYALRNMNFVSRGVGYSINDVLTIPGQVSGETAFTILVLNTEGLGAINLFSISSPGTYATLPAQGVAFTGGTGSGATINFQTEARGLRPIGIDSLSIDTPNSSSGYAVGDSFTLDKSNGTSTQPAQGVVTSIATGGVVSGIRILRVGDYWELDPGPSPTTKVTGAGSGLDVNYTIGTQDALREIDFSFSQDQNYLLVFTLGRWYVYRKEDVGFGANQLVDTNHDLIYTNQQISEISWTQELDTILIFHKDVPTQQIIRTYSGGEIWTLSEYEMTNIPTYAFGKTTTGNLTVGYNVSGVPVVGSVRTITAASANFVAAADVGKKIRVRGSTDGTGNNFSCYMEIKTLTSTTAGTAEYITLPLISPNTVASFVVGATEWLIEEDEFSTNNGYPRCGTFYEGRLMLAATAARPSTLYISRAGDTTDFNSGGVTDDYGIVATLGGGVISTILSIHIGRHIQLLCDNAEFYSEASALESLTPGNISFRKTADVGSKPGIQPFTVDGVVYYVQKGGGAVREFHFIDNFKAYDSDPASIFWSHLINNPVDMALKKSLDTTDGNYLWIVNEDGSLIAFTVLKSQLINAAALRTTQGDFKNVAVLDQTTYFHAKRWPGGVVEDPGYFLNLTEFQGSNANPQGVALSSNGETMLITDNRGDRVYEYALNFKDSLKRVVYTGNSFFLGGQTANPKDVVLSPDGHKMFIVDLDDHKVLEYNLDEPNTLKDGNVEDSENVLDFSAELSSGTGFDIDRDTGKQVIIVATGADKIKRWELNTPWTFGDGYTFLDMELDLSEIDTSPQDVKWSHDLKRFFVAGSQHSKIYQFTMPTDGDTSTAIWTHSIDVSHLDTNPFGMSFNSNGKTLMWVGTQTERAYQLDFSNDSQIGEESDWIEIFNDKLKFDAAICEFDIDMPVAGVSDQLQLAHEPVGLIIDGELQGTYTVDGNGDLTFPQTAKYSYQLGLPFPDIEGEEDDVNVLVETLPVSYVLKSGTVMGKKKRVVTIFIKYVNTQGFYVQGRQVPFRFLPNVLDVAIPQETGSKELKGFLGYDRDGRVKFTQKREEPLDMTLIGTDYEVSA